MEEEKRNLEYTFNYSERIVNDSISCLKKGRECYIYKEYILKEVKAKIKKYKIKCRIDKIEDYWVIISLEPRRR